MIQFFKQLKDRFNYSRVYLELFLNEMLYRRKRDSVLMALRICMANAKVIQHVNFVLVKYKTNKVYFTIYSTRPGIIIGVRGSTISEINDTVSQYLNKPVNINIKPYDPFKIHY